MNPDWKALRRIATEAGYRGDAYDRWCRGDGPVAVAARIVLDFVRDTGGRAEGCVEALIGFGIPEADARELVEPRRSSRGGGGGVPVVHRAAPASISDRTGP